MGRKIMARMALNTSVDSSREHVVIEVSMDGKPLGHIELDGTSVEKHIHDLAQHRANLNDPVTLTLDAGSRLEAIVDPRWRVPKPIEQGRVLALRHPGLGWLSFVFPDKEARAIAEGLTKESPAQPKNR
jgi:hypothetical protein